MKLRGRLDKLEPAARERWRNAWGTFYEGLYRHLSDAALERFVDAAGHSPTDEPYADALDEAVTALDYGLEAWCDRWDVPDLDESRDYGNTPETIPLPPEEPGGKWDELTAMLGTEGVQGDAAALLLHMVASARAVREYRVKRESQIL